MIAKDSKVSRLSGRLDTCRHQDNLIDLATKLGLTHALRSMHEGLVVGPQNHPHMRVFRFGTQNRGLRPDVRDGGNMAPKKGLRCGEAKARRRHVRSMKRSSLYYFGLVWVCILGKY